jgi:cytochrome c oxidase assembly factor CtaG
MTTWKLLFCTWEFHPTVVIGCAALLAVYMFFARGKFNRQTLNYSLGVLVLFLALVSPIDPLGDDYLFSAHMMQHMMLGIVAPVLLVAGIPESFARAWLKLPFISKIERFLGNPILALIVANATFWVWHLPSLYNLTLENETIHIMEHLMFIATGCMLWWPVFKPIPEGRLNPMSAIIYMGIAASLSTILGIIFTISDTPYYESYAHPHDELGALKLIREDWGLSQIADQQLGGAIMWEPAGAIFLWAMMVVITKWFKQDSELGAADQKGRKENVGTK